MKPVDVSKYEFTNYRNPDGQRMKGCETIRGALEWMAKETEKQKELALRHYFGGTCPSDQLRVEFREHINKHSAVRDIALASAQQGVKDCRSAILERQKQIIEELKDYTEWNKDERKWGRKISSKKS